jgi:2-amino-4-hydroxy-6-hydroxymethyldihydropteridine diphosphokinase
LARFVISLGSSEHCGADYLLHAKIKILAKNIGLICGESLIYKNSASMTTYNSAFYNCALAFTSNLHPVLLYRELLAIELELGRIRTYKNARRTIDIDIILCLDFTYNNGYFFLPHKGAFNRIFFVLPSIEALTSADWPVPISLLKSKCRGLFFKIKI